ncbi:glycogenin-1b isoform X1 [Micropterus dolomieu]|uniref:glycogenin-1b isoform X1 n=1 Tax=Micropterus dolomieu TaxID=147949 RepID=UPI001E8EDB6C|nr:glycogenin-1b isoform X1 [Micropterus dolomieu]
MADQAFVTLATNDNYARGAMVLGKSLHNHNTSKKLVALIGPQVAEPCQSVLKRIFDEVKVVDVLDSGDTAHLAMMKRPDLGITFTKLHCWTLTHYSKCVFMDADTLVLSNIDELFDREELSAAPDPGWPDCFNSGVFVFRPSMETYGKLLQHCTEHGSFDDMEATPRWSISWGRPSHGVTHLTPKPNGSQGVCMRPLHIPPSYWTGGPCTPALWCQCCRSNMETSLSTLDVWRVRALLHMQKHSNPSCPPKNGSRSGSKVRQTTLEWTHLTISRGSLILSSNKEAGYQKSTCSLKNYHHRSQENTVKQVTVFHFACFSSRNEFILSLY